MALQPLQRAGDEQLACCPAQRLQRPAVVVGDAGQARADDGAGVEGAQVGRGAAVVLVVGDEDDGARRRVEAGQGAAQALQGADGDAAGDVSVHAVDGRAAGELAAVGGKGDRTVRVVVHAGVVQGPEDGFLGEDAGEGAGVAAQPVGEVAVGGAGAEVAGAAQLGGGVVLEGQGKGHGSAAPVRWREGDHGGGAAEGELQREQQEEHLPDQQQQGASPAAAPQQEEHERGTDQQSQHPGAQDEHAHGSGGPFLPSSTTIPPCPPPAQRVPVRVFVYEHLCAGALADQPASLRAEGWAMLAAVLTDLGRCPGVEPATLVEPALLPAVAALPGRPTAHAALPGHEEAAFRDLARRSDKALVIAPESGGLLYSLCRRAEEGARLLGPGPDAVQLTADKLTLAEHLATAGVPTPPAVPLLPGRPTPFPFPLVCKPRDGAGSQATFLVRNEGELASCRSRADAEGWPGELLVQPLAPGLAVSVALLAGPGRLRTMPAARQHLSADGRCRYRGGQLPLAPPLARRARRLARRAARAVPGLHGYFGVDLVLGPAADGSADTVIEINPRLTTSYVGLRALARFNLAEALLAVTAGQAPPAWRWRRGEVSFHADGGVRISSAASAAPPRTPRSPHRRG
jgi:predicted ATP-grasp superfamily ATP-dependent carboligase